MGTKEANTGIFRESFTETPVVRPFPIRSHPPADQAGFLLPLALSAAFMLLLSSLSLSAASLQAHQLRGAERMRQQAQDQLASAAHQIAGALQGPYSCLLRIPSSQWQTSVQTQPCTAGLNPELLMRTQSAQAGSPVLLRRWQPDSTGTSGELWLQVGDNGQQKHFALNLVPGQGLREVG